MLVLTDYLRKMGYKIPESYDQNIKDMPKNYKRILKQSYEDVYNANDPLSVTFTQIMDGVEQGTGLDLENILSTQWIFWQQTKGAPECKNSFSSRYAHF